MAEKKVTAKEIADGAAAAEIEVKKNTIAAGRKVKEAAEKVAGGAKEAAGEAADKAAAIEIETKKKTRAVERKAKETSEEITAKIKETASDVKAVAEIEVKRAEGKAKRAVKTRAEKAKAAVDEVTKPARKLKAAKMDLVIESSMGRQITLEAIAAKVPAGTNAAYIKAEENKIYWVRGEETGAVDIW